ncbi:MAG: ankyrin repeat domain-containing protein [Wolbachia sp.]
MAYSDDDVKKFYRKIAAILKFDNRGITSLEDLIKEGSWKEINFQDKCEEGHSLGDLLLKLADENGDLYIRAFFLRNGFKLPEQEQVAAANEEEEQNTPDVEESRADSNEVSSSNSRTTQFPILYNSNDVQNLYLNINEIVKQKPQASLEELSKELNTKIDFKQKFHNGYVLGDLLLALAIEKSNLDFIKFLFKNELKIISIVSQQEGTCHISKTINGQSVLSHAVHFSNTEILDLLLQNVNAEQSKLRPESNLYKLCQQLKNNALSKAMDIGNEALVTLLISAIEEKQEISNVEEIKPRSGSNGNVISRPVATVPPVSTNDDNHNNKNEAPVSTRTGPTVTPNNDNKANGLVDAQFSPPHEKETKYKKSKESFYTSLRNDVVGVVVTGLFIAAAVMVPSLAGALVCSVLAILVVMVTGLHVKNFTLPSYREMKENKVEPVNSSLRNHAI